MSTLIYVLRINYAGIKYQGLYLLPSFYKPSY
jgi:hypothetical protein